MQLCYLLVLITTKTHGFASLPFSKFANYIL